MSDSLKINLTILPEEGLRVTFAEDDAWFRNCFSGSEPPEFSLIKAEGYCLVTKSGETVYIRGELAAQIRRACDRCLEPATIPIDGAFAYTLVPEKKEFEEELELSARDLETSYYRGDFIDLAPIVCEQIVLQTPMKILCAEDCRGLCPNCGANLNAGACNCRANVVDDRLAVLKKFRVKN